jgi:hypothetical protein
MNFLQLCQKAATESGTIAGIPQFTTVAGASGRVGKLVGWVSDAYRDIQNERGDWLWMRKDFTKALIADQPDYLPSAFGLNVARWLTDTDDRRTLSLYDPDTGISDERPISFIPYDRWRDMFYRGEHDAQRPRYWSVRPADRALVFGNTPDKAYVIRGEYIEQAVILAADDDTPDMPEQYHGLIIGEALRIMAGSDEALNIIGQKAISYDRLRYPLVRDQTPNMTEMFGGGLTW